MASMRFATTLARVTSLLGAFVAIAVLMGLIGAGLLLPVIGSAGTAAREGVDLFDELPGKLDSNPLAQQSRILTADGKLISTPALENRIIVGLEQIAPVMQQAQIAIEDERYREHGGVDMQALGRAFVSNATTEDTQGGSTLTQQYVKLTLLEEARRTDDTEAERALYARSGAAGYVRKLRELKYAITLEERLTKDEILEGYLNLSYYGDRAYGVEAAARHYFGVKAINLNLAEAATLAGIVRAPSTTDPINYPEAALARRNVVLDKMHEQGMISNKAWKQARASKISTKPRDSQQSCLNSDYPYFCEYVTQWLLQNDGLGATKQERLDALTTGGLTIETTLVPELAKQISKTTRGNVPPRNPYKLASAAAMVEPGTGKVLAIGQSSEYALNPSDDGFSATSVNWSVDKRYGESDGFQIGSVAKAFTLVTALEQGVPVEATLAVRKPGRVDERGVWVNNPEDPETPQGRTRPAGVFFKDDFDPKCTIGEDYYTVTNAEDENHQPSITLRRATAVSVNTAFTTLASQVGTCKIRDTMARMGLNSGDGDAYGAGKFNVPATYVLGADNASPVTVAAAYAGIASGGLYCPPVPVSKITDSSGNDIPLAVPECEQVVEPDVAAGVAELMQGVVSMRGSGFRAVLDNEQPAGGKTGTADKSTHTWFAGYTPQVSAAVWIGYPNGRNFDGNLRDLTLGGTRIEGQLYGSKLAAPMWKELMTVALDGKPVENFEKPSDRILEGEKVLVPAVKGLTLFEAQNRLTEAGLSGTPIRITSYQPEGTVLRTSPAAFSAITSGTPVKVFVSKVRGSGQQTGSSGGEDG